MISDTWYAGDYPNDRSNPWLFRKDGTFATLRDEHGGNWSVEEVDGEPMLKMVWDTTTGHANWLIVDDGDQL